MAHLQATGVSLAFGDRDVLSSVTLTLSSGDRCALTGANGSGKTSLMRIIAGLQHADSGSIAVTEDARIAYLPQSGISHSGLSLAAEVDLAFGRVAGLAEERDAVAEELGELSPGDDRIEPLLHRHHDLEEQIQRSGYYERDAEVDRVLRGLGFRSEDADRLTDEFSGGWQMRIALAKVLLDRPEFLLLDEPTNYLDVEARVWLGRFLSTYDGGVLMVSHDRRFLDETVNTVWELFLADLRRYRGTYTEYERQREQEIAQIKVAWQRQQDEIERIEDFIRRFRFKPTKARQVQSRVKMLEKMVPIEIPENLKHLHVTFPDAPHSGREVVRIKGVSRSYGSNRVLDDVEMLIEKGERVVLVGPNGAGKSTLMRIIADRDKEYTGTVEYGSGVALGFYADDDNWLTGKTATVGPTLSVEDAVSAVAVGQNDQQIRNLLGAFLFRGDDIFKDVNVLSGGERSRLAMLQLLLQPRNLLVLDEPTNHLDMASKEVLLGALQQFGGTIVFVSHDREFIEKLATRVVELAPDNSAPTQPSVVRDFPGDYAYYAWRLGNEGTEQARADGTRAGARSDTRAPDSQTAGAESQTGTASSPPRAKAPATPELTHAEQKARRSRIQKLEREIADVQAAIDDLESRAQEIHDEMARPEVYADGTRVAGLSNELGQVEKRIEEQSARWERLVEEHEKLDG